jgi:hypothetical protein
LGVENTGAETMIRRINVRQHMVSDSDFLIAKFKTFGTIGED